MYLSSFGQLNFLRFEQLAVILKCYSNLGQIEQLNVAKESAIKIGEQLLSEDSKLLQELKAL